MFKFKPYQGVPIKLEERESWLTDLARSAQPGNANFCRSGDSIIIKIPYAVDGQFAIFDCVIRGQFSDQDMKEQEGLALLDGIRRKLGFNPSFNVREREILERLLDKAGA